MIAMPESDLKQLGPFYYVSPEDFEAWGFAFPSGFIVLEWCFAPDGADELDNGHHSIYHSWEDFRTVCTGRVDWGITPEQHLVGGSE